MRKGVVTVVLPVYNVEKYLERCLKSIANQTYRNLEIIIVDDGSTDRCPEICDEWEKKDNRIKVVHKENAGLGFARNTGIENATGEYICFFDSDDYIDLNTIEKIYELAEKEKADIVTFGFCNVNKDGTVGKVNIPCPKKLLYEGNEIQEEFLPDLIGPDTSTGEYTNLWMSVCGAFYSMQLIKKIEWRLVSEREIISEDIYSLLLLYKHVNRVSVLQEALYFYCENSTSLTHTYRKDRYEKIKHFYKECLKVCQKLEYGDAVRKRLMYPYLSNTIAAMKMIVSVECSNKEKKLNLQEIIDDETLQSVLEKFQLKKEVKTRKIFLYLIKHKEYEICFIILQLWIRCFKV